MIDFRLCNFILLVFLLSFFFSFFFGLSKLADFEILNGWNVHSEWKLWKRVIKYKNYRIKNKKSICIQPEILLKRFKTNKQANETVKHVKKEEDNTGGNKIWNTKFDRWRTTNWWFLIYHNTNKPIILITGYRWCFAMSFTFCNKLIIMKRPILLCFFFVMQSLYCIKKKCCKLLDLLILQNAWYKRDNYHKLCVMHYCQKP